MPPTSKPPALGDGQKSEYVLFRYEQALPGSRKEIISAFEGILAQGGVQKVVVELGRPIQITRLVDKTSIDAPQELPPDDFWNQVRNGRMEQTEQFTNKDGLFHLFNAFALITTRKLKPRMLYCHSFSQLRKWLALPDIFPVDYIFGIETAAQADLPEDAVVLAATGVDETDVENTLGLRIPVDYPTNVTKLKKGA